jgi:hypothetical protein
MIGLDVKGCIAERVNMRDVRGIVNIVAVGVGSLYHQYTKFIKICQ